MAGSHNLKTLGKRLILIGNLQSAPLNLPVLPNYNKWIENCFQLSSGAIQLHQILEKIVCPPLAFLKFNQNTPKLIRNPEYNSKCNYFIRTTLLALIQYFMLFCIGRISWLNANWKRHRSMEQLFLYMVVLCMTIVGLSAWLTLHSGQKTISYILSERLAAVKLKTRRYSLSKKASLGDLFMLGFGLGCGAFPLFVFAMPFQINYDPLPLMYEKLFSRKISELDRLEEYGALAAFGSFYAVLVSYGAGIFLSLMLIVLVFVEGLQELTNRLYPNSRTKWCTFKFSTALKYFRMAQILMEESNRSLERFLGNLVVVGILLAGWCAYATLMMFYEMPLISYLACVVILLVCLVIDFILIGFATIPNRNGKYFKAYWSSVVNLKVDRKSLKACPEIGYNVEPIRNVSMFTALSIAHAIINCAVNLILLKLG